MGGGGGRMEVELSHGAVAAMSQMVEGLRPVLQVADTPRLASQRYRLLLSDGVHSQQGVLAMSLNHLITDGNLRRGTVVRVLDYICAIIQSQRVIIVIQLEVLSTDCKLIGCPIMYDATPTQSYGVPCSGGLVYHEPCVLPGTQRVADSLSLFPGYGMLDSSFAPGAKHAARNLRYGGCYGSVLPQNKVDAKMQQLSLDDHKKQWFPVTGTIEKFGLGSAAGSSLPPSYLAPSPICRDRSSVSMNVTPIAALNRFQTRWTIKARVTAKTDLRRYKNVRKVFSFDLLDAEGGEIRAICSNLQADRYFDLIEVDKVFLISRGTLKLADKKYNPLNSDLEIVVDDSTSIEICSDDSSIPIQQYNFRQIRKIENMEMGSLVDLLGVVTSVSSSLTIVRTDGTEAQKRTLQLEDISDRSAKITFWGKLCDTEGEKLQYLYDSGSNPILAVKGCCISDLSSRSLVAVSSTQFKVNPDFPEAEKLRQWYLDTKTQKLSLDDHQNQRFPVTTTVGNFGPGTTTGSPLPPLSLLPSVCTDRSCVAMNAASCLAIPIAALNPYKLTWTIKARVTAKTDLRHYGNARGTGKVFSFDVLDAQGGEIRVTCFNLQVDRYFDLIEVDKVYLISRGTVKPAQKLYNPSNNDYEIFVDHSTSIEVCSDDDSSIPKQQYAFRQISEIENMENGSSVDLLGVVTSVSPSATVTRKDGTGTQKRTFEMKDMSNRSVRITFWGKFCDREGQKLQCLYDSGSNPILAVKGCRISYLSGRSLATVSSTQLEVNPDFPEAERMRQWYLTEGKTAGCVSLSCGTSSMIRNHVLKTIAQIKDEKLGYSDEPDLITVRATISHVNAKNFCYPACTLEFNGKPCNRKVTENSDGTWYCDRCTLNLPECEYRYLLMCQLQDHTGDTYATAFQEVGTKIIGYSAEELFILRDNDEAKWEEIMQGVCWQKYLFKLKIMEETFYGEPHVKCNIVDAEKLDASATSHHRLEEIQTVPGRWARNCPVSWRMQS